MLSSDVPRSGNRGKRDSRKDGRYLVSSCRFGRDTDTILSLGVLLTSLSKPLTIVNVRCAESFGAFL